MFRVPGRRTYRPLGRRRERREVAGHIAQDLLGEQVLDGIDRTIGDEFQAQEAPVAGMAVFIGKENGGIKGRQLVNLYIGRILGIVMGQSSLEKPEEHINCELGQDHSSGDRPAAAGEAFGVDITIGPYGGFSPVNRIAYGWGLTLFGANQLLCNGEI